MYCNCNCSFCNKKKQTKRKRWIKEWITKRKEYTHLNILNEIKLSDPKDYKNYFRMSDVIYNELLNMLRPFITKMDTNMRDSTYSSKRKACHYSEILGDGTFI